MKNKQTSQISLFKRIFIPMFVLVAFILCLIIGIIYYYDILGQLNENSRSLFNQQINTRGHYLESAMVTNWSNLELDADRINKITSQLIEKNNISLDNLHKSSQDSQLLLKNISDSLITTLRNHGTTGAYVILSNGEFLQNETQYYPGLYISDNDPDSEYESGNSDLLLVRSPVSIVNELNISTDSSWRPSFEFQDVDSDLYQDLFNHFQSLTTNPELSLSDVGCWLKPYKLHGNDNYCISYILPLIYDNHVYGAIGVDISFAYLQKLLVYDELIESGHAGYMLAIKNQENEYQSLYLNGPYFTRTFEQFSSVQTVGDEEEYINNKIYCYPFSLNLYNSNTPFSSQQWVLMGIIDKTELYSFTTQLMNILLLIIAVIIAAGTLLSFVLSRYIAKPIVDLATHIANTTGAVFRVDLEKTHIIEIDQLITAIEKMGNDVLESSSRFTNIIRLANTKLAGFEIDYENNELFITEGFFDIFLLKNIETRKMSVSEFQVMFKAFNTCATPTQNKFEYIYHMTSLEEEVYLRLRYHETENKCVGLIEEISDMIKERKVIEHERDHDVLTGLINRRAFQRQMKRLFSVDAQKVKIAALLMMDLDNLKSINDKFGHDCGDAYIKGAAMLFKEFSPKGTIVSRTSGDEFYLFYYGYSCKEDIIEQIKVLKKGIDETVVTLSNHQEVKVHVSGGVAWYPHDSTKFEELQRYSDYAMYSVKRSIKGEIGSFNIQDYENNSYIMKKRMDFHQLIDEGLYTYRFQPIVDIRSGQIFGYEALLRSLHPTLKDPKEIISIAKLEAQLNKIELLTWQNALRIYAEYCCEGKTSIHQKIFINSLSNQILSEEGIKDLETKYQHILSRVVLEVTEEEENNEIVFKKKKEILNRWNAQIALDDYGSGYNSERNLLSVNPQYVKIDMDIIRDIDNDLDKQKIVENIISYCHERDKYVIAEGVETLAELKTVKRLGVDYVQGYFFAKAGDIPVELNEDALEILMA